MIPIERILATVAGSLEQDVPEPDANGDRIFELSGGMILGVRELHGGMGVVGWSRVAYPPAAGDSGAKENQAKEFLRLSLARFNNGGDVIGTRSERGALILYVHQAPDTEEEWLDAVRRLLNETESQRRLMESGGGFSAPSGLGGMYGLR